MIPEADTNTQERKIITSVMALMERAVSGLGLADQPSIQTQSLSLRSDDINHSLISLTHPLTATSNNR